MSYIALEIEAKPLPNLLIHRDEGETTYNLSWIENFHRKLAEGDIAEADLKETILEVMLKKAKTSISVPDITLEVVDRLLKTAIEDRKDFEDKHLKSVLEQTTRGYKSVIQQLDDYKKLFSL